MLTQRQLANVWIGLEALSGNKLRSFLTALGVVFGVAAVIAMLAIGNGAQQELLEQMKLVGVNNIVIKPADQRVEGGSGSGKSDGGGSGSSGGSGGSSTGSAGKSKEKQKASPGLTLADVEAIQRQLGDKVNLSPEIMVDAQAMAGARTQTAKALGVWNTYFQLGQLKLVEGDLFSNYQQDNGLQVCIIGKGLRTKLFPGSTALGKQIKVGKHWLTVIGEFEFQSAKKEGMDKLGLRDYNMDVCMPLKTMLLRYTNRTLVTQAKIRMAEWDEDEEKDTKKIIHQLDRLVVQVNKGELLNPVSDLVARMLKRRHNTVVDFEITIPELLLKQQQRTKDIFNIVLGAIAGISLLVGGIGIMNIMLASVLERIKEIGLRISLGAKRSDIVMQFLVEAVLISSLGGFTGIILGVSMAWLVSQIAGIPTVVSPWSIIISFGVAASVGLIFGIAPARRAANQNPIESLRYE